jgi:hypothetical protein
MNYIVDLIYLILILQIPTSRLAQNQLLFNEIFIKPKVDRLQKLEEKRE